MIFYNIDKLFINSNKKFEFIIYYFKYKLKYKVYLRIVKIK